MIFFDTNVAIAIINNAPAKVRIAFEHCLESDERIAISTVVLFELHYGSAKSRKRSINEASVTAFASRVLVVPFDADDAILAGGIRAGLESRGTPIGPYDTLIAAQALRNNATLITANTRGFERVTGLRLEDWTK